jgi:endonuclease YncB( thermonuclease family)
MVCEDIERDHYGRRVAECWIGRLNLNSAMLASGQAQLYERSY